MRAGSPFSYDKVQNLCTAIDGRGEQVGLLGDVAAVWQAIATEPRFRCSKAGWAYELLDLFEVGGKKMRECAAHIEIHSGSKQEHLNEIAVGLGIALGDMVFFDDRAC